MVFKQCSIKKPELPEEALKKAEGMIAIIEMYANSTNHPIHISEGIKLQEMVQKIVLEAEKLQTQFERKKERFFTSETTQAAYEEALIQVKKIEDAAVHFQEQHAEAKAKGECWLPKTNSNTDYEAFQTLTQEIEALTDLTETHKDVFKQSLFSSFLNAIKALLE
ncbi:MAG: hypothetical protein K0U37_09760, partial [Gammaproteobacteria bacterium]|nr:hypothetical protein [Gammaproteobacteria bacterium]